MFTFVLFCINYKSNYLGASGSRGETGSKGVTGLDGKQGPTGNSNECIIGKKSKNYIGMA